MRAVLQARSLPWLLVAAGGAGCVYPQPRDPVAETGAPESTGLSVYDVHAGSAQDGNRVLLLGVVASSPWLPDGSGFFVQEPDGGPNSGVAVRAVPGLSLPQVAPGDLLDLNGYAQNVGGRFEIWVSSSSAVEVVGAIDPPVETAVPGAEGWAPWVGVRVRIEDAALTGCPAANGATPTDAGLAVGGPWAALDLARGDTIGAATGVVGQVGSAEELWPAASRDVVVDGPGTGCTLGVAQAREERVSGRIAIPEAVWTAGPDAQGRGWVQAPGGGAWSGLAVEGLDPALVLPPGALVSLRGLLSEPLGRATLLAEPGGLSVEAAGAPVTVEAWAPDDASGAWLGGVVSVAGVTVGEAAAYGAVSTDAGLLLDDALLSPIPAEEGETLDAIGILDQWPDGSLVVVPRTADDLAPAESGDTGG